MARRPLLLVVEDDKVLRDLYRVTLSLSNFAVHACEDGLDALQALEPLPHRDLHRDSPQHLVLLRPLMTLIIFGDSSRDG